MMTDDVTIPVDVAPVEIAQERRTPSPNQREVVFDIRDLAVTYGPTTAISAVSQTGPHCARSKLPIITKIPMKYPAKSPTVEARPSHRTTRIVAPRSDQNLERTAA